MRSDVPVVLGLSPLSNSLALFAVVVPTFQWSAGQALTVQLQKLPSPERGWTATPRRAREQTAWFSLHPQPDGPRGCSFRRLAVKLSRQRHPVGNVQGGEALPGRHFRTSLLPRRRDLLVSMVDGPAQGQQPSVDSRSTTSCNFCACFTFRAFCTLRLIQDSPWVFDFIR